MFKPNLSWLVDEIAIEPEKIKQIVMQVPGVIKCFNILSKAILGGIIGSGVGKSGIPQQWLDNIWEFPRTINWMENLAKRLVLSTKGKIKLPLSLPFYFLILRNLFFLLIVILHRFKRLLPI